MIRSPDPGAGQHLTIETADLIAAVRQLRVGFKGNAQQKARLSYTDGQLEIALQGASVSAPAQGKWRGTAQVAARVLAALVRLPPAGERVEMRYEKGRIRMGRILMTAEGQDIGPQAIDLPLSATMLDYLAVKETRSRAEIIASGLETEVEELEKRADRLIARAAKVLGPLEIGASDLKVLFQAKLRDRVALEENQSVATDN